MNGNHYDKQAQLKLLQLLHGLTPKQQSTCIASMRGVAAYNRMCTEGKRGKSDGK